MHKSRHSASHDQHDQLAAAVSLRPSKLHPHFSLALSEVLLGEAPSEEARSLLEVKGRLLPYEELHEAEVETSSLFGEA